MRDTRFDITNPLVTKEDLKNHYGVGGLFRQDDKILTIWHNKYSFWTIPIGKVSMNKDPFVGFIREMKEELGITILGSQIELMGQFTKTYNRSADINTVVTTQLYSVASWDGTIVNNEPNKHAQMKWSTLNEIKTYEKHMISDMMRFVIFLEDTLKCPSRK